MTNLHEAITQQLAELDKEAANYYTISETSGPLEARHLARGIEIAAGRIRKAILSTVRPDDGTTISAEWLEQFGFKKISGPGRKATHEKRGLLTDRLSIDCNYGNTWWNAEPLVFVKTRGQLRLLCRALGVELREGK